MKTYKVSLVDLSKDFRSGVLWNKYVKGLSDARKVYPDIKVSYCYNSKCFTGFKNNLQLFIKEV